MKDLAARLGAPFKTHTFPEFFRSLSSRLVKTLPCGTTKVVPSRRQFAFNRTIGLAPTSFLFSLVIPTGTARRNLFLFCCHELQIPRFARDDKVYYELVAT